MKKPIQQKGVAAVEFAILLPLLLLIVFGITEFGRALYAYNTLVKATRDAARYYAIQQPGNPPDKADEIMNLVVFGNTEGTGDALAAGLDPSMVTLEDRVSKPLTHKSQGAAPVVNLVTVTVSGYAYESPIISFFMPDDSSSFTFADISTTMKGNL
jgi:Flp pilus assembly protein TadG